jgi:hypothetical protein
LQGCATTKPRYKGQQQLHGFFYTKKQIRTNTTTETK